MADLKTTLKLNLEKFAERFRETQDFAWLIRHAQEAALLEQFEEPEDRLFKPVRMRQLREVLQDEDLLQNADPTQQLANFAAAKALVAYLGGLSQKLPILNGVDEPAAHRMFREAVCPGPKEMTTLEEQVKTNVADATADPEVRQQLLKALQKEKAPERALKHVLDLAYLKLQDLNLYQNPILAFLPKERQQEFVKSAAPAENKGARLSDVLLAVQIASGKYTQEFLQIQREVKAAATDRERRLLQRRSDSIAHSLLLLNAYEDFLARAKRDLAQLMRDNPEAKFWRYSQTGRGPSPLITDDPFIQRETQEKPETFADFLHLSRPTPPAIKTTLWDGTEVPLKKFAPPQANILESYRMEMLNPAERGTFQDKLAKSLADNLSRYRQFGLENNEPKRDTALASIFVGVPQGELFRIHGDVLRTLQAAIVQDQDAALEAELDTDEVQVLKGQSNISQAIRHHEKAQQTAFVAAKDELIRKYEPKAALKGAYFRQAFNAFLDEIWTHEIADVAPADLRALKEADFFGEPTSWIPKSVSEGFKQVFPEALKVMVSPTFKSRYAQNDENAAKCEKQYGEVANPELESVNQGVEKLKRSGALLRQLGFVEPQVSDPKEYRVEFNKMVSQVFAKSPEELQKLLGDIPLDSLYSFVGRKYAATVSHDIICTIACRFSLAEAATLGGPAMAGDVNEEEEEAGAGRARSGGSQDCRPCSDGKQPNAVAIDEATNFFRQYTDVIIGEDKHKKIKSELAPSTIGGRVAEWHQNPELRAREADKPNFANVMWLGAAQHFGAFLDRTIQARLAETFAQNKQAANATPGGPDKFDWSNPENPRPRDLMELAALARGFADPQPGRHLEKFKAKRWGHDSQEIQPGQRFDKEQVANMATKPDDIRKSIKRMLRKVVRLGRGPSMRLLIEQLQHAYAERRDELLNMNQDFAQDIIEYDPSIPESRNPFVVPGFYSTKSTIEKTPETPAPPSMSLSPAPIDFAPSVLPKQMPEQKRDLGRIFSRELLDGQSLLEQASKLENPTADVIEKLLSDVVQKRDSLGRMYAGSAQEFAEKSEFESTSNAIKALITKLTETAAKLRTNLAGIHRQQDEYARRPLRVVIDQILQVAQEPKWSKRGLEELTHVLTSLVDGSDEELAIPIKDVAVLTLALLKQILAGVQRIATNNALAKIPPEEENQLIKSIVSRLEDKRQSHYHEIAGDEDEHPGFHDLDEPAAPPPPVVKNPVPPTPPKTIIRKR